MAPSTSLEFPFYYAQVELLGKLFYPVVQIKLKTRFGWQNFDFLVDTGADVTTIPYPIARTFGIDIKSLPQSKTQGVGGIRVDTWNLNMPIIIGNDQFDIHASITAGNTTPPLLGKKDILDRRYNLIIDSVRKVTILKRNS